jgi:DNA-binding response OmpR family regulator
MTQPSSSRRSALIVEDDDSLRELLCLHLSHADFETCGVSDGVIGLHRGRASRFDLILLDVMLPQVDGITVCRALRESGASAEAAILILTAKDAEFDKVLGLESGADDYVTKPFSPNELMARVSAIFRRYQRNAPAAPSPQIRTQHGIQLDPDRREVRVHGVRIPVTRQEFDLLHVLIARPGVVFSRESLLAKVWKNDSYVDDRTVDVVISRLRRKIEDDPQSPRVLLTSRGAGYRFADAS